MVSAPDDEATETSGTTYNLVESYTFPVIIICENTGVPKETRMIRKQ
jgi:hypothetical protein